MSICEQFGIKPKTGYKWLARYNTEGPSGLEEKRRTAHVCPHETPDEIVDAIVALRKQRPKRGPKKLRAELMGKHPELLWPAASTIGDVLKRHGLIRPRRRRVRTMPSTQPFADCAQANDLWCVDFKGHFALGDGTRCHHDRHRLVQSIPHQKIESLAAPRGEPVRQAFEQSGFREFGLPTKIRSDNGAPFASLAPGGLTALSIWWIQLGIHPERIEPGQPQQNGRQERFHRTLKFETLDEAAATLAAQQRVFDRFRHEYNDERPHEALGQVPPARCYEPSWRPYPRELIVPSYDDDFKVRWTSNIGYFSWRAHNVLTHKSLASQPIGIRQISEYVHEAWYGSVFLGHLDDRDPKPGLRRSDARSVPHDGSSAVEESPVFEAQQPG